MPKKGNRYVLKTLGFAGVLFLIFIAAIWWRLPDVLTVIGNQQLAKNGFSDSSITISEADSDHLTIDYAKVTGSGWDFQINDSHIQYELMELFNEREVETVIFEKLQITVNPAELEVSDEPLTIALLQNLPAKLIEVRAGRFTLISEEEVLEINWSGKIVVAEGETLVFTATKLQINKLSPKGDRIVTIGELQDPAGVLMLSMAQDGSQAGLALNLSGIESAGANWKIEQGSVSGLLGFEDVQLAVWTWRIKSSFSLD
jgi:hypothetical protein